MLSSSILLPPSPNWYGSQLLSLQPSTGQVAYAGHNSVVVACLHTHKILRTMCAGPSRVTSLCWAPVSVAAHQLVAGHEDGSLRTWDARTGACVRSHKKKGPEISALVLLDRPPAAVAVAGDVKGGLQTWAFQTSAKPKTLNITLRAQVTHMVALSRPQPTTNTMSPSSGSLSGVQQGEALAAAQQQIGVELVAAACADGSISVLDVDAGVVLQCFSAHRGCIQTLSGGGWDVSPPGLQALGCTVLVTVSSEEGTVKVWQVAMGSRSPSVTRLATLTAPGSRDAAAGRNTRQRSTANQWLSACVLPTLPHSSLQAGSIPSSSGTSSSSSDQELAHCCWVAVGLPSGELWLHCIHTGHGRVDPPYKLHNVHNRPIYSIVGMLDVAASNAFSVLPSSPQPGTGGVQASIAGSEVMADQSAPQSSRPSSELAIAGLDVHTLPALNVGEFNTTQVVEVATGKAGCGSIVLASISQDRNLGVSRVSFKLGVPPVAAKAAAKKQPAKVSQDNVPAPSPVPSTSTPPSPLPPPPPPPPPELTQDLPSGPTSDGDTGKGGFRMALGPPADRGQRGFVGRGRGQVVRGAGAAPGQPAPGAPELMLQPGNQQDAADTNTTTAAATAAAAQQQVPVVVTEPDVLQCSEFEHSEGAAGPMRHVVSGHQVLWKASGLGGYGHSVDVSVPTEHGVEAALQKGRLNLAVGSGDRTIRTVTLQWPVAAELLPGKAVTMDGDTSTDETAAAGTDTSVDGTGGARAVATTSCETTASSPAAMRSDQQVDKAASKGQVVVRCTAGQPNQLSTAMLWYGLTDQVICVARHPLSARYIAFGCQDGQVGVYDFKAQAPYLYPTRHQGPVLQLCWYAATYPQPIATPSPQPQDLKPDPQAAAPTTPDSISASTAAETPQVEGSSSAVPISQPVSGPTASVATMDGSSAATGKGKSGRKSGSGAASEHAAAVHAACQSWSLMSCGAEGRLLTWQLPGHDDMAAAIQQGGMPAGGPAGGGASRGGADRAGRWGVGSQQPAAGPTNDLLARLLPLIPAMGVAGVHGTSASQATASAAAMSVVPNAATTGDLLAIATAASTLAVFQQQPQGQASISGHVLRPGMPGYSRSTQTQWGLVWSGVVEGAAPQHMSCAVSPQRPQTLFIASASSIGSVSCYHVDLQAHPASQAAPTAASAVEGIQLGDASRSVTALCWLADASAVAVAYADQTIQVWYVAHALFSRDASQPGRSVLEGVSDSGPLLLCTLKGHTDAVMSLVSRSVHPQLPPQPQLAPQLISSDAKPDTSGQGATNSTSQQATCAWLFSASRDQSVRGWVLHLEQLIREAVHAVRQQQQQRAAAALQQAKQATAPESAVSGADVGTETGVVPAEASTVQRDVAIGMEAANTVVAAGPTRTEEATARQEPTEGSTTAAAASNHGGTAGADLADESESVAESEGITRDKSLPSWLTAAPTKSDITGIPGARLPGAKKVPVLGQKPLLQAPPTGQAAQDAQAAFQQLSELLTQQSIATRLTAAPGQDEPAAATDPVLAAVSALGDPVALAATGQLPRAPEKLIMSHLWMGDVRRALQVAIEFSMLTADLVSSSASQGRAVWSAASRLYAAQQEQAGQVHVAVMHLLAIGDRPAAAAVYRRAGLLSEAKAVEGQTVLMQAAVHGAQ